MNPFKWLSKRLFKKPQKTLVEVYIQDLIQMPLKQVPHSLITPEDYFLVMAFECQRHHWEDSMPAAVIFYSKMVTLLLPEKTDSETMGRVKSRIDVFHKERPRGYEVSIRRTGQILFKV